MGIISVYCLRRYKKTMEIHIVCFNTMELEKNSQQENIAQRQEAERTIVAKSKPKCFLLCLNKRTIIILFSKNIPGSYT